MAYVQSAGRLRKKGEERCPGVKDNCRIPLRIAHKHTRQRDPGVCLQILPAYVLASISKRACACVHVRSCVCVRACELTRPHMTREPQLDELICLRRHLGVSKRHIDSFGRIVILSASARGSHTAIKVLLIFQSHSSSSSFDGSLTRGPVPLNRLAQSTNSCEVSLILFHNECLLLNMSPCSTAPTSRFESARKSIPLLNFSSYFRSIAYINGGV